MATALDKLDAHSLRNWIRSDSAMAKIWLEGFHAAEAGYVEDANPYLLMKDGLIWMDGWGLYQLWPTFLEE